MNNKHLPPRQFHRFFRWYCRPQSRDYIEGDLLELYFKQVRESGKRKADILFIIDVLLLFLPGIIGSLKGHSNSTYNYAVISNYFKTAWRNLWKNKGFSAINIFGLTVGISCCILIFLFIQQELSYDRFNRQTSIASLLYNREKMAKASLLLRRRPGRP